MQNHHLATRPHLMFFLVLAGLTITTVNAETVVAIGTVYADTNANGRYDTGEHGLSNVGVSNGSEVVFTDRQGDYAIEIDNSDAMVFVIKPRNYQLPIDSSNVPQFYYLHRPEGAPTRRFPGAEATGPLPEQINFGLLHKPEPDRFRVLVMADTQTRDQREVDFYQRDVISELQNANDIAFGLTLGDIAFDDLSVYPNLVDATARVGVPWFYVFGNHDMNLDAEDDRGSDDTFEAWFGPTTYAFQYGPVHFIYFDDVIHWLDAKGQQRYIGGLRDDQFTFIKNYLQHVNKTDQIVLAMHIALPGTEAVETFRRSDRERLFALLDDFPNTLSLSGHSHLQRHYFMGTKDGWRGEDPHHHYNIGTVSGSWWSGGLDSEGIPHTTMRDGTPNGYAIIEFATEGYLIDYKAARSPAKEVMRITGPGTVIAGSFPVAEVYANVYNGNQRTQVKYRIDNGEWQPMQQVFERDPFVTQLALSDLSTTGPRDNFRLTPANESTHLWKTQVPTNLSIGEHFIVVSVTDMFGRESRDSSAFTVQPTSAFTR